MCNPDGMGFGACTGQVLPAVETCATPEDDNCDGSSSCNGTGIWSKGFPVPMSSSTGEHIAVDPSGSLFVTGHFEGTMSFGVTTFQAAGMQDVFVAKLDANGNVLWAKGMGGPAQDSSEGIAVDAAGRMYVAGYYEGTADFGGGPLPSAGLHDAYIVAFAPDGSHLWSKRFGDALDQRIHDIAIDPMGSILVAGSFRGTVDFGGGPLTSSGELDLFVAKLDAAGNHIWSRRFGSPVGSQQAAGVGSDSMGNVLLTGQFTGTLDIGGGPFMCNGTAPDGYLAKLDPNGQHIFSVHFGSDEDDHGEEVLADAADNVILVCDFQHTIDLGGAPLVSAHAMDFCLAKYGPGGQHLWSRRFGDLDNQHEGRIAIDGAGNILLAGTTIWPFDFGGGVLMHGGYFDAVVAKYDPSGTHIWSRGFGDADWQFLRGIALSPAGEPIVTGRFQGTLDFGAGSLVNAQNLMALYVAKLVP